LATEGNEGKNVHVGPAVASHSGGPAPEAKQAPAYGSTPDPAATVNEIGMGTPTYPTGDAGVNSGASEGTTVTFGELQAVAEYPLDTSTEI